MTEVNQDVISFVVKSMSWEKRLSNNKFSFEVNAMRQTEW